MKTVRRYDLEVEPRQAIKMPFDSEILSLGYMNRKPVLYVIVNDSLSLVERFFVMVAQDKELPQRLNRTHFLGEFQFKGDVGGEHTLFVFEER